MKEDIALTSEQLEIVFDTLDAEKNGYLTIDQFLKGFSKLIKHKDYFLSGHNFNTLYSNRIGNQSVPTYFIAINTHKFSFKYIPIKMAFFCTKGKKGSLNNSNDQENSSPTFHISCVG